MAGRWNYGGASSKMRDNGSRMPFGWEQWEEVQNQGRAPEMKPRFTFDPLDAADECVSEEDEGYFSPPNSDFDVGNKPSQWGFSGSSSSPLLAHKTRFRPGQTPLSHQDGFLAAAGHILSGSVLRPLNAAAGSGDDGGSNAALPVLQSSTWDRVRVELNCGREQKRQVSVEVQERMLEPVHGGWPTVLEQNSTYETTFHLQVKVESVDLLPDPPGNPRQTSYMGQRTDWEHEKGFYLDSVNKHISGNQGGRQDVMTELLDLMTETSRWAGGRSSQPQHPSDLTCRNY